MCLQIMIPVDTISEHIRRDLLWPGQVSRILNQRVPTLHPTIRGLPNSGKEQQIPSRLGLGGTSVTGLNMELL